MCIVASLIGTKLNINFLIIILVAIIYILVLYVDELAT